MIREYSTDILIKIKKAKLGIFCVSIFGLCFILYLMKDAHLKNSFIPSYEYYSRASKSFSIKNCSVLDKAWNSFLTETSKMLPGKEVYYTKDYKITKKEVEVEEVEEFNLKNYQAFYETTTFKNLEIAALKNDECGVKSTLLTSIIYDELKMHHKKKEDHQRLLKFAETNNLHAISSLCSNNSSTDEIVRFCSIVYYQKSPIFNKDSKDTAEYLLMSAYKKKQQLAKSATICKTSNDKKSCYDSLSSEITLLEYSTKNNKDQYISLQKQFVPIWEDVYFNEIEFSEDEIKRSASYNLRKLYSNLKDTNGLTKLYRNSLGYDDKNSIAYSLYQIADELYNQEKYEEAFIILNEIFTNDEYGLINYLLGEMYIRGKGTKKDLNKAIKHYNEALIMNKYNQPFRSMIFNEIGAAYLGLLNYTEAFNNFYRAATMGFVKAQLNLAEMYTYGKGTFQDFKEGFAWVSIAVIQGLNDANDQTRAIYLKNWLNQVLVRGSAKELNAANILAKQYYKQYVLKEDES